jgi:hypothetical protein
VTNTQTTDDSIHTRHLGCRFDVVDRNSIQDDVRNAIPQTATRKKTNKFPGTATRKKTNKFPGTRRCRLREYADVTNESMSVKQSRCALPKNLIGCLSRAGSLTTTMVFGDLLTPCLVRATTQSRESKTQCSSGYI